MRRTALLISSFALGLTMETAMAHDLTLTRIIDAAPDRVWAALTETDRIAQWWGPEGFTAPKVVADVALGKSTLVCMTAPGFPLMCNTWTYTEIIAGERLVFDHGWSDENGNTTAPPPGLPADIPAVVPHVVAIKVLPDGRTELSWSEFGYASAETAGFSKMGLESVLDKLVASVE